MNAQEHCRDVIRFVADEAPKLEQYAIANKEGKILHVYDVHVIRLLSEGLGTDYDVTVPSDGEYGKRLPDGNWTGMVGMVHRSEADIAVGSVAMTEERCRDVRFAFPHVLTETTFMTDKLVLSRQSSVLSPYSCEVWASLATSVIVLSVLFRALNDGRMTRGSTFFRLFGSLVEQSVRIRPTKIQLKLLLLAWFLGSMIVSSSYKAVLLSFLSVPNWIGIRDFTDLSRAVVQKSVACYTYRGSYLPELLIETGDDTLAAVGECLKYNQDFTGDAESAFLKESSKKAFVTGRTFMIPYEREYFVSEDSISVDFYAFPYSKTFGCDRRLEELVHRLVETGIFAKIKRDENFMLLLLGTAKAYSNPNRESELSREIRLVDVSDAFCILISGWILSLAALVGEMVLKNQKRS